MNVANMVRLHMGPDELIDGLGSGVELPHATAIPMEDGHKHGPRQATVYEYFRSQPSSGALGPEAKRARVG